MTKRKSKKGPTTRRHNAGWTEHEVARLRKYASDGLSARLAGEKLGRSTGATKYKAMVEKIEFHFINQPAGVQRRLGRKRAKFGMKATLRRAA